jgi:hypothetical protein
VCVCVTVCLHGVFCPGCSAVATTAVLTVLTHALSARFCVPSSRGLLQQESNSSRLFIPYAPSTCKR